MHELSLCEDLMDQVITIAKAHYAKKVVCITVRIGPLSGVEPLLLESAFLISRGDTLAEDAEFITENLPICVLCHDCDIESEATVNNLVCGNCDSYNTSLVSGDELILARVELENAD